jgi:hypothetical protein
MALPKLPLLLHLPTYQGSCTHPEAAWKANQAMYQALQPRRAEGNQGAGGPGAGHLRL